MLGGLFKLIVLFIVFYIIYSLVVNAFRIYRKIRRDQAEFRGRGQEQRQKQKNGDRVIELDKDQYKVE
jgi:hypothetical protein